MAISIIFSSLYEAAKPFEGVSICCISDGNGEHDYLVENNSGATGGILSYNGFVSADICIMLSCRSFIGYQDEWNSFNSCVSHYMV